MSSIDMNECDEKEQNPSIMSIKKDNKSQYDSIDKASSFVSNGHKFNSRNN